MYLADQQQAKLLRHTITDNRRRCEPKYVQFRSHRSSALGLGISEISNGSSPSTQILAKSISSILLNPAATRNLVHVEIMAKMQIFKAVDVL